MAAPEPPSVTAAKATSVTETAAVEAMATAEPPKGMSPVTASIKMMRAIEPAVTVTADDERITIIGAVITIVGSVIRTVSRVSHADPDIRSTGADCTATHHQRRY